MDTLGREARDPALERALALAEGDGPVRFFPVRHHSPACSLHLGKVLEAYKPDCILIEGPSDANHLVEHIAHPETKAPVAIYYSSLHKEKDESGETVERRNACYYPLLDFSPELVAIRHGVSQGVPTRFIDLPYRDLSVLPREEASREGAGSPGDAAPGEGKNAYYDDYYLSRSAYISRLCQKQGCRHHGELWEKLFELEGPEMDSASFVRAMLAFCHFSRVDYPQGLLVEEGCPPREAHMAAEIKEALGEHRRILVVTGGFHTAALAKLVEGDPQRPPASGGRSESYLIPYSLTESDQLAGYASGMPYPAFYQRVHEGMIRAAKKPAAPEASPPFDEASLYFLARSGELLRRNKESISLADEIAALAQARGLASLRGKPQLGVYELLDAVDSAYVKESGPGSGSIYKTVAGLLRGDRMGELPPGVQQIPLLLDFQAQAARFRLKVDTALRQEITLDILSKPRHRQASAFFHQLKFLEAGFGQLLFGPDYRERDASRVREKWRYASSARVLSALVEVSHLGGTVREAASTLLGRRQEGGMGCGAYSRLLIDAAVMDLTEHMGPLLERAEASVAEDGSFPSLAQAASNLLFLENARWLLELPEEAVPLRLLAQVYHKACALLPALSTGQEEEDRELARSLRDLYGISRREDMDPAPLLEALEDLLLRDNPPPCLQGGAAGLLYAGGALDGAKVLACAAAYFSGTGEQRKKTGRFLEGLFLTAWDVIFSASGLLEGLSGLLGSLEGEDFLSLLPDLRLAFSAFTPGQIDRIGDKVAAHLGVDREGVLAPAQEEAVLALGRKLDQYAQSLEEVAL